LLLLFSVCVYKFTDPELFPLTLQPKNPILDTRSTFINLQRNKSSNNNNGGIYIYIFNLI
jgi:hypothetical protein